MDVKGASGGATSSPPRMAAAWLFQHPAFSADPPVGAAAAIH